MESQLVITFAVIGVLGLACQWIAWRLHLPAILFLLLTGILAGPVSGLLNPDALFGDMLFPLVSLAVAVILFEGSLTLKFDEIRGMEEVVWRIITVGVLVSWMSIAWFAGWLLNMDWHIALLFGALVVVTGPTVIVPMVRSVRPNARITNILRWESILIDPLGALLAVLVFNFIVAELSGGNEWLVVLTVFGKILLIGTALGCGAGHVCGLLLRNEVIPVYLQNVFILISVFAVFALSDTLEHESGLLAVTIMGIWLANMRDVETESILDFKESLSILLISGLFIILAARVDLASLFELGWLAVALLAFIHFIARPLKVWVSTLGTSLTWQEKTMIAWIGPRGIIAAAVSALFALRLQQFGIEQADLLVSLTFVVIIGTVVFQSITAKPLASMLGVVEQAPVGILFVGANMVSRVIAKALNENGFDVLLADSYHSNVRQARMMGLKVFHGNPISRLAERELNLVGIGRMMGMSQNDDLNTLAVQRYQREFDKKDLYMLVGPASPKKKDRDLVSENLTGQALFAPDITYGKLASLISQGAEMRTTTLSAEFTLEDYQEKYGVHSIPMFLINHRKRLVILSQPPKEEQVQPGFKIIALISAEFMAEKRQEKSADQKNKTSS